ncbi:hypothetical protein OZX61_12105 (plasmid) [Acinetobacter sp. ESL0695]|uniref:hypothetical protein n=1 Tax=Acinetobacter sp. ESL0695 TaxID=2983215 RepID=UPI0023EFD3F4|nr:hypothetical protein [Acinetobacter sp. ESL0695]WEV50144.1 hypothetical protein OZX61_12105 [Acinetobacter sp. ESL0695]
MVYQAADRSSTTLGTNGLSFKDNTGNITGPSITSSGIDAGGKTITNVAAGVNSTDAVNKGQLDSTVNIFNTAVNSLSNASVQYDKNTDGSINKGTITLAGETTGTTIKNVANGQISSDSKDAINGAQISGVSTSIQTILGGNAKTDSNGKVISSNIGGTGQDTIDGAVSSLKDQATKAKTAVTGGDNIAITALQNEDGSTNYQVSSAKDLSLDRIKLGNNTLDSNKLSLVDDNSSTQIGAAATTIQDNQGNNSTVSANGLSIQDDAGNKASYDATNTVYQAADRSSTTLGTNGLSFKDNTGNATGPSVTAFGIDAGGKTITNVAAGVNSTDAVNKGQLDSTVNIFNTAVNSLSNASVQYDKNTDGSINKGIVTLAGGTTGTTIKNVANGQISSDSKDAVNGAQVANISKSFAIALGQGSVQSDGSIESPIYSIAGKQQTNVSDAINALNNLITTGNTYSSQVFSIGLSAPNAIALGNNSKATGISSVAMGDNAIASGNQSISIGTGNQVTGNNSGAFGDPSIINGANSYSVGNNNTISTDNTFALGNDITQTTAGSVVLGNNSASRTASGVSGYTPTAATTADQAAITATTSTTGSVAVGDAQNNIYRQVTGVAAGTADSDAVNVAQLKAVDNKVLALKTEGNTISDNAGHSNASTATSNTLTDGTNTTTTTASGTTYGKADPSNLSSTQVNQTGLSFKDASGNSTGPSVTASGLDAGSLKVTNVQNGTIASNSKDAVNGGQVASISQSVANAIGGVQVNQDGTLTNPTYNIAGGTQTSVSDALNALNQAVESANTTGKDINVSKVTVSDSAGNSSVTNPTGTTVKDNSGNSSATTANGLSVQDSAGNKASYGATSTVYQAADHSSTTIGTNGLSFKDSTGNATGPSVTTSGIDAGDKTITNVAAGVNSTDAVNKGQLDAAVNTVSNTVNTLSDSAVQYDKNADGSVNKSRVTLGDGTTATTLTNVADGQVAAGSKDAVNGGQLANVQSQVTANTNSINSLNSTVSDLATGKSGTIQQADKNGDINIGKDSGGTKVNMANNTGASRTVTGVSAGTVSSTSSDAINGSQLYQANTSIANVLGGNAKVATDGTISTSNIGGTGQSTVDGAVSNLNGRVGNLESAFNQTHQELSKFRNETNAGIAGAMAIASLGQPIEKGASAISLGTGNWNNSTSIALGASIISEDHQIMGAPVNYIWKAAGTSNFRGESGGGASVTVTWR